MYLFYEDVIAFREQPPPLHETFNALLFCQRCIFGKTDEDIKNTVLTVTMHSAFYIAICTAIFHISSIIHVFTHLDGGLTTRKSAFICCSYMISFTGFWISGITSTIIQDVPAIFSFYELSLIIGILQLLIQLSWLLGMIFLVKDDEASKMLNAAIPNFDMALKSNEELNSNIKVIRLSDNESANINCRISDAGFSPESLIFLKNGKPVSNTTSHGHTYQINKFNYSGPPMNFLCSAKRINGKVQTREMRVTGGLKRELYEHEILCAENKCKNDGVCVAQKEFPTKDMEFCICPLNFNGKHCEYLTAASGTGLNRTGAATDIQYLYFSMGFLFLFAVVFAALYGREKLKRAKTKKQLQKEDETSSLQAYEVCDGREDAIYAEHKVTKTYVINEYDNVPKDERKKFNPLRPIIRGTNPRDSIGVTEEIARTGRLQPDYGPSVARPILSSDSSSFYP